MQQHLPNKGIPTFRYILAVDGYILEWEQRVIPDLPPAWRRCYTKLVSNLVPIQLPPTPCRKTQIVYVAVVPLHEGSSVWQFVMSRSQWLQRWLPGQLTLSTRNAF